VLDVLFAKFYAGDSLQGTSMKEQLIAWLNWHIKLFQEKELECMSQDLFKICEYQLKIKLLEEVVKYVQKLEGE